MDNVIPHTEKKRVVIIGGGFGGLALANKLDKKQFQVILIDKNNYHQFQPLLYQVATAGLESGSISFPFRSHFRRQPEVHFRLTEVISVCPEQNSLQTTLGPISYDYMVIANGTTTNFFGNQSLEKAAYPMKTLEEALELRNAILGNIETALTTADPTQKQSYLNIVIVGGGATGVEIAGAIAEMKRYVIPSDYHLEPTMMNIYLIEGTSKVLGVMSSKSSLNARRFLEKLGVTVITDTKVTDYTNHTVMLDNGKTIPSHTLIWVSGVIANKLAGLENITIGRGARIAVDPFNNIQNNIYAIGDVCLDTSDPKYPAGHPQVAPVAMQQGKQLAKNLKNILLKKAPEKFIYHDQGSMATVGRNLAVADISKLHLNGFIAWAAWMLVHLRSILGIRNKIMILLDWIWNYITYDRSARSIIFIPRNKK